MKLIRPYIEHILQECEFLIEESEGRILEDITKDPVLSRAFIRSLEIIGEAVKRLPDSYRKKHSKVPWKEIAGMRDKLIHEYFGVNYEIVWRTIKEDIPRLKKQIMEIIKKEGLDILS